MCTATSWNTSTARFAERFPDYESVAVRDYKRLMVRPTEMQVTCLADGGKRLQLKPFGTRIKSPGQPARMVVNARRENLSRSPLWRKLSDSRRCLVFVSAFYECRRVNGAMEVFRIAESIEGLPASVSAFAGLHTEEGGVVIVTRPADAGMQEIHDRMPAILGVEALDTWLQAPASDALGLLALPPASLHFTRITSDAFKLPPDAPELLEEVAAPKPHPTQQELF